MPFRTIVGLAAFWLLVWWPAVLGAVTNEEFLDLCAGGGGRGDAAALKKAVAAGADVNFKGPGGLTPLMIFAGTHADDDWQVRPALDVLLAAGAEVNATSDEGGTALSYAVRHRAGPRLVSALVEAGAQVDLGVASAGGLSPLMMAAGVDPDPLVSAVLLAAGADPGRSVERDGRAVTVLEAAEKNPNPKVPGLIKGALATFGRRAEGQPLFAALPEDPGLRRRLAELDADIRSRPDFRLWPQWSAYLKWQIDLAAKVETRQASFGQSPAEAWLTEYEAYLNPAGPFPADRLVIQGPYAADRGAVAEIMALRNRSLVVSRVPGQAALAGYERASGRELWTYRPSALSGFFAVEDVLLVASSWGGQFGEAAVLDPLTGRVLQQWMALDSPNWAVDPGRRVLVLSTPHALHIFDLKARQNQSWSWYELLETQAWEDSRRMAREAQNQILAAYQLSLTEEGWLAPHNARLFDPAGGLDQTVLDRARKSLAGQGFQNLDVLVFNYRGPNPNFILGPACPDACTPAELDTPLFLVNPDQNRIDFLRPGGDRDRTLTRRHLALAKEESGLSRPLMAFSPSGAGLAVTDTSGRTHFFAAQDKARHLGALPAEAVLDPASGRPVREGRLTALLDDDVSGRPLVSFTLPGPGGPAPVTVEIDLASGAVAAGFRPRPDETAAVTALAAGPGDQVAVALDTGELRRLDLTSGALAPVPAPPGRTWTALAFSGDGRTLAAADRGGLIHLERAGQAGRDIQLNVKDIRHLALDQAGHWAWVGAEADAKGRPVLALADLSGQAPPVYRDVKGPILSLKFHTEANYAVAVEDAPMPAGGAPAPAEPGAPPATRWGQGRADIISYDHLRRDKDDGPVRRDPGRLFVGLAPDLTTLLYQDVHPARADVDLGREALATRQAEVFDSRGLAFLAEAVHSPDRRLALLMEKGREPGDEAALYHNRGGGFAVYDLGTGRELARPARFGPGLTGGAFLRHPSRAVLAGRDGSLTLWDLKPARPMNILTWVFLKDGGCVALDKDFRLDAPERASLEGLHLDLAARPGQPLSLENFRRVFQTPGLAGQILTGRELPPVPRLAELNLFQAEVKIKAITREPDHPDQVAVTVELSVPDNQAIQPVRDLELLMDGQMAAGYAGENGLINLPDGRFQTTFRNLPLPRDGRTQVTFTAYAFNTDRVRSKVAGAALRFKPLGDEKR